MAREAGIKSNDMIVKEVFIRGFTNTKTSCKSHKRRLENTYHKGKSKK